MTSKINLQHDAVNSRFRTNETLNIKPYLSLFLYQICHLYSWVLSVVNLSNLLYTSILLLQGSWCVACAAPWRTTWATCVRLREVRWSPTRPSSAPTTSVPRRVTGTIRMWTSAGASSAPKVCHFSLISMTANSNTFMSFLSDRILRVCCAVRINR